MSDNKEEFAWENNDMPEVDFFGEGGVKEETPDVKPEDKATKETDEEEPEEDGEPAAEKKEEESPEDMDFFSGAGEGPDVDEDESEDDEDEEEGETPDENKKPKTKGGRKAKVKPTATLEYLKEKGLVDFELEEGEELTDDLAEQIMEDDFDTRVDARIQEMADDMPEDAANFFKFVKSGGSPQQYLLKLAQQQVSTRIVENIDLENESNQELVIREQMATEGDDQESIEAQIEFLKDSGKMKTFAEGKYRKWDKKNQAEKAQMVKDQKKAADDVKAKDRKLKKTIGDFIKDKDSVGSLKLTKKEKKELPSYMTDRTVALQNGSRTTKMAFELHEAMQDETKALIIAKLVKSDFNFEVFKEDAEDKTAKEVRKNIRRNDNKPSKSGKSGSPKKKGSLADLFE